MLRVALRPRSLGILALMLAAAVICGLLANWQWSRAQESKRAEAELSQSNIGPPSALSDVLAPQAAFPPADQGRFVSVTGTFDASQQRIVTGRSVDGSDASIVLTPLVVTAKDGTARLPVTRGYFPEGAAGLAAAEASAQRLPKGEVTVSGWLQSGEEASGEPANDGTLAAIAPSQLINLWGGNIYSGYVSLSAPVPNAAGTQPKVLPRPDSGQSSLNLQNLGYAAQWLVFGGFALYLWYRTVRDTYTDERLAALATMTEELEESERRGPPEGLEGTDADGDAAHLSAPPGTSPQRPSSLRDPSSRTPETTPSPYPEGRRLG